MKIEKLLVTKPEYVYTLTLTPKELHGVAVALWAAAGELRGGDGVGAIGAVLGAEAGVTSVFDAARIYRSSLETPRLP